jgi:hypothetical protein
LLRVEAREFKLDFFEEATLFPFFKSFAAGAAIPELVVNESPIRSIAKDFLTDDDVADM